jgi:hypothetical protein
MRVGCRIDVLCDIRTLGGIAGAPPIMIPPIPSFKPSVILATSIHLIMRLAHFVGEERYSRRKIQHFSIAV